MAQGHKDVTVTRRLWVQSSLEEMKHLFKFIFPFLRSGVEAKCDVEFHQSARNASRIQSVFTLGSLCLPCCVREADFFYCLVNILIENLILYINTILGLTTTNLI